MVEISENMQADYTVGNDFTTTRIVGEGNCNGARFHVNAGENEKTPKIGNYVGSRHADPFLGCASALGERCHRHGVEDAWLRRHDGWRRVRAQGAPRHASPPLAAATAAAGSSSGSSALSARGEGAAPTGARDHCAPASQRGPRKEARRQAASQPPQAAGADAQASVANARLAANADCVDRVEPQDGPAHPAACPASIAPAADRASGPCPRAATSAGAGGALGRPRAAGQPRLEA